MNCFRHRAKSRAVFRGVGAFVLAVLLSGDSYRYAPASEVGAASGVVVLPNRIELAGSDARQTILVEKESDGDYLGEVDQPIEWTSSDEKIARVEDGQVLPIGDGDATLTAHIGSQTSSATVVVRDTQAPTQWEFGRHVIPVFSKAGCNTGACHGALAGKNGFKLSLNGYDVAGDYAAITEHARGRRIELGDPGRSLILAKPSGALPHKGGLRLDPNSDNYQIVSQWITGGAKRPTETDATLERIEVLPAHVVLAPGDSQRFIVRAFYDDGRVEDVTRWAKFTSTETAVANVDSAGNTSVVGRGEASIVVWFSSKIIVARVTSPFEHTDVAEKITGAPSRNLIDEHVHAKLRRLNLAPSPRCSDDVFLRRAYLDTVGVLPTLEDATAFLDDPADDKRDRLIDALLASDAYVDYWAYRWSDVLLINGKRLRPEAVKTYYNWIRGHVQNNTRWDAIVREVVTASGDNLENGAANFYAIHNSPEEMAENVSQAFLGLSINCAKCHNHPLEKWTNDQYYAMANLFARVRTKGWGGARSGDGALTVYVSTDGELLQPRTGRPQPPAPLDGDVLAFDDLSDRREHLAAWLTAPENPYFTRSIVNRVWHAYFGVGLVEEVDDLRVSNPASNDELLEALSQFLVENQFDLKALMRLILQSETYQRSSEPIVDNAEDQRFFSRYYPRRLMAEVLLDAISQVSGVPTAFDTISYDGADVAKTEEYKVGTRSTQLFDSAVQSKFLTLFGRNERDIVCECQRSDTPSMVQVLHLNNGDTINQKLRDEKSTIADLIASKASIDAVIDDAFLRALSRRPSAKEKEALREIFADAAQASVSELPTVDAIDREVIEDLYWSLMSSREFLFQH